MIEEIDELDGPAAIEALREIQRVCESYKGRVPQKQDEAPDGSAEHEGAESTGEESSEGFGEFGQGEEPAIEIEVSTEPNEPEPVRFMDYGKPSKPRSVTSQQDEPRRGPGRPRKAR